MIGKTIGPYRVVAKLGEGGMGEVYRARDVRLDRDVAIKALPAPFANDPERIARFEREAKVLASLNHPHIGAIYGLEEVDHRRYLILEFIDGPTLADVMAAGPLPLSTTVAIARQIAEALEAAHEQGIIHRDLKPANVKVKDDGTVKVLDFGLAKALDSARAGAQGGTSAAADIATGSTLTSPALMTGMGAILGTATYMSPEQARGRPADKRSDIWAFGCVLYEMLTGRRAFAGDTLTDVLAAVVKTEPDWAALPPDLPAVVRALLRRCLRKDPHQRQRDIGDARLTIDEALSAPDAALTGSTQPLRARWARLLPWALATLVVGAAASAATWWIRPAPTSAPVVTRFSHLLPEGQEVGSRSTHALAISPDGTKVVYGASRQLYLRDMGQLEARPIRGTEGGSEPAFSPDGQWIVFAAASAGVGATEGPFVLKKVPVYGGAPPEVLAKLSGQPSGVSWHDTTIVFGMNTAEGHGIQAVSEIGGNVPRVLLSVDAALERAANPRILDGGRHVLFTRLATGGALEPSIVVHSLDNGQPTVVVPVGVDASVLPGGFLVYARSNALMVERFDMDRRAVAGGPRPLVEGVSMSWNSGAAQYAVSRNGTLVYSPAASSEVSRSLVWVNREGGEESLPLPLREYGIPRLSRDGSKLAVAAGGDIWQWARDREPSPLTFDGLATAEWNPVWAVGDRRVFFDSSVGETIQIVSKAADGTGGLEVVKSTPAGYPETVSPDGRYLIYHTRANVAMVLPLDRGGEARPLAPAKGQLLNAVISPDGRWVAYQSNESGRFEIYVRPFPMDAGGWQMITTTGGRHPAWAKDGSELFFISAEPASMMTSVAVLPGSSFTWDKPNPLFPAGQYHAYVAREYDVAPDRRFLMIKPTAIAAQRPSLVFVSHWLEEVRGKMGTK